MNTANNESIRVEVRRQFERPEEFSLTRGPAGQWLQVGRITGTERDGGGEEYLAIELVEPVASSADEDTLTGSLFFDLAPGGLYVKRLPDRDANELYALEGDGHLRPVRPEELQELLRGGKEPAEEDEAEEGETAEAAPVDPNQKLIAEMLKHTMNLIPALCGEQGLEVTYIQSLDRHALMINGGRDECVESLQSLLELYNRIVRMREGALDGSEG